MSLVLVEPDAAAHQVDVVPTQLARLRRAHSLASQDPVRASAPQERSQSTGDLGLIPSLAMTKSATQLLTLGLLPTEVELTLGPIVGRLRSDGSPFVRSEAARSLTSLGPAAAPAAGALVSALNDEEDVVRLAAAIALKFVPITSGLAEARLVREAATNHPDRGVRVQLEAALRLHKVP